jgi:hypothetical protein
MSYKKGGNEKDDKKEQPKKQQPTPKNQFEIVDVSENDNRSCTPPRRSQPINPSQSPEVKRKRRDIQKQNIETSMELDDRIKQLFVPGKVISRKSFWRGLNIDKNEAWDTMEFFLASTSKEFEQLLEKKKSSKNANKDKLEIGLHALFLQMIAVGSDGSHITSKGQKILRQKFLQNTQRAIIGREILKFKDIVNLIDNPIINFKQKR